MLGIDYSNGTFCAQAIVIQNPISRSNSNVEVVAACYKLMAINDSQVPASKGLTSSYDRRNARTLCDRIATLMRLLVLSVPVSFCE